MKTRNLLTSFVAVLMLSWSNVVFADDVTQPPEMATVNINEADAATLSAVLDGVGLKRAEAIVLYRQENGRFYSAEELSAVQGIGDTTVLKNQDKIKVE